MVPCVFDTPKPLRAKIAYRVAVFPRKPEMRRIPRIVPFKQRQQFFQCTPCSASDIEAVDLQIPILRDPRQRDPPLYGSIHAKEKQFLRLSHQSLFRRSQKLRFCFDTVAIGRIAGAGRFQRKAISPIAVIPDILHCCSGQHTLFLLRAPFLFRGFPAAPGIV